LTVCSVPTHAGEIVAWGHDYFNQVSGTPTGSDFTAIVAGGWHGYALRADGTIAAWGNDDSSQVSGTPTGIFVAVAAGGFTGYALAADGSITAWGYNGFGGQVTNAPTGTGYTAIAGGYDHAYALAADGSITAWGLDVDGQVSNTPTGTGFTAIAAGEDHGYALRPDGSIAAWGRDLDGQVSGTPTGTGFIAIAAGSEHGLAMAADGSVTAWGDDMWGQVTGAPTTTGFAFLSAGGNQGYLLSATGEITAWGLDAGQVSNAPTASGFTELSGGQHHCYALLGAASFCDATDGALASCPCLNAGAPNTGCDLPQGTGGVGLTLTAQENGPQNRVTWSGTGFPAMGTPASVVIRAATLDPGSPVVFGDGQRCVGTPLVRLAATLASGGAVTHVHGHGVMAGPGTFYYQLWFRSTPIMFCDPVSAFNLSNGRELIW
jgi:hypothetical protein